MKKYNLFLILLGLTSTFAFSQTRNISTVRTQYPEVYNSIEASAKRQWGDNDKVVQSVVEGQVDAFISILDLNDSESVEFTDAIIKNSLPDTKDQNIRAIKNYRGTDLFYNLKCDWYNVESDYRKSNKMKASSDTIKNTSAPIIKTVNTVEENDSSFVIGSTQPTQFKSDKEIKTNTSPQNSTPGKESVNGQKTPPYYRKEAVNNNTENNGSNNTRTSTSDYDQKKSPVRKDVKPVEKKSVPVENNVGNTQDEENLMIWF